MTVETITPIDLATLSDFREVALIKIDVDGPEIFVLRSLAADLIASQKLSVLNIIAELTVSGWRKSGVDDDEIVKIFNTFYAHGFSVYPVYEKEFPKYPSNILQDLDSCHNIGELRRAYRVPKQKLPEVLWMANRITKNLLVTRDATFTSYSCILSAQ